MGNPTGFMQVERALPEDRDASARLGDWLEVHEHMEPAKFSSRPRAVWTAACLFASRQCRNTPRPWPAAR